MENKTFKAMLVRETTDRKYVREITHRSTEELPPGEVLIRVSYSSLNYKDALSAIGNKGVSKTYPHTPGIDASGVVEESTNDQFRPRDEVLVTGYDLGMNTPGGFGQYIRVPAEWVVSLPDTLTLRESMIFGTAGFTAGLSVARLREYGITPDRGEILVTGASGGVGSMAVSILAKLGYEVVAASGKPAAKQFLLDLGAKTILSRDEIMDSSGSLLLKGRWAGAVDTVGGDMLSSVLRATHQHAAVSCCGNVASPNFSANVYPFILRGIALFGIDSASTPRDRRLKIWEKLAGEWKPNHLDKIASGITLEQLDENIDLILKGGQTGRKVVEVRSEK